MCDPKTRFLIQGMKLFDPKRTRHLIALLLAGAFMVPSYVWGLNTVTTGFQTGSASNIKEIDAHTICRDIHHTGSNSYFVPTKFSNEWTAFRNGKPADVTLDDCITVSAWKAGCFVDTEAWDVPIDATGCGVAGTCTETDSIRWSAGDYQPTGSQGLGDFTISLPSDYTATWTGACTGTGNWCMDFNYPNGTHTATVTIRKNLNNAVVFTRAITATKQTTGACGGGPLN